MKTILIFSGLLTGLLYTASLVGCRVAYVKRRKEVSNE